MICRHRPGNTPPAVHPPISIGAEAIRGVQRDVATTLLRRRERLIVRDMVSIPDDAGLGIWVVVLATVLVLNVSAGALSVRGGLEVGELLDPCREGSPAVRVARVCRIVSL